jgi:hypothetical protein
LTCRIPCGPGPGEQGLLLDEAQRIVDRSLMGPFDRRRHRRIGDRPQRRHRLHRRERQVEPSDRLRPWTGTLRELPSQLASINRRTAMLSDKELPRYLRANPRPVSRRDRGVDRLTDRGIQSSDPLGHLHPERCRIVDGLERSPQPHNVLEVPSSEVGVVQLPQPCLGQRMQPAPEQSPHLLRRHRVANVQTIDSLHAGTNPHPGRLAPFGVIRGKPAVSLVGRVQGSDLPGQIVITRPGAQLVQAHRHIPEKAIPPAPAVKPTLG